MALTCTACTLSVGSAGAADNSEPESRELLNGQRVGLDLLTGQALAIQQHSFPFHSPYSGPNSLPGYGETHFSHSYLLSAGKRINDRLSAYVDVRFLRGQGLGQENGLGGYANADFTAAARDAGPYVFRAFLRGIVPLGTATKKVERDIDRIPGEEQRERIEWKIGRFMATDDFDQLRYAQSAATQFVNLGLVNNPAWDNPQTGRGYADGLYAGLIRERWELRLGTYRMPLTANGPTLDRNVRLSRSDNVELTSQPFGQEGPLVRLLLFRNLARMGRYRDALDAARLNGTAPSVTQDERYGRRKRGVTTNIEMPLAHEGETGLFGCAGWNDGATEDFAFTEVDRNVCGGAQVSGAIWGREKDRLASALLVNGLSRPHRDYLAAGGTGFQLGDGKLRYGTERIWEIYYRHHVARGVEVTPDFQYIANPGFNRDRGPAKIVSVRVRLILF